MSEQSRIISCSYLQGKRSSPETIRVEMTQNGENISCEINVTLLRCGIDTFSCLKENVRLTAGERLELLRKIYEERKRITDRYPVKTLAGWEESGLELFEDFCFPGDQTDEDLVNHFASCVPPVTLRWNCTQNGEPYSHERDENGRFRPTYATFCRIGDQRWQFKGYCFRGETRNRVDRPLGLQQAIDKLQKETEERVKYRCMR